MEPEAEHVVSQGEKFVVILTGKPTGGFLFWRRTEQVKTWDLGEATKEARAQAEWAAHC